MSCFTFDAAMFFGLTRPVSAGSDVQAPAATVSVAEAVAQTFFGWDRETRALV